MAAHHSADSKDAAFHLLALRQIEVWRRATLLLARTVFVERNVAMSISCRASFKLAATGLCCLLSTVALAQQGQSGTQSGSSQSQNGSSNSGISGQTGRSSAAQSGRSSSQQSTAAQSGQRYTANYGASQTNSGGQSQEVDQFFANCLLADNRAEVELSQLAEK